MSKIKEFHLVLKKWTQIFMRHSMHSFTNWMSEHDLSRSQVGALMMINHRNNCQITHIGDDLGITTPAASQLVDRLVQLNMVERKEDPEDRRVKILALSIKGRNLVQNGFKAKLEWVDELTDYIPETELESITEGFRTMIAASEKINKIPHKNEEEKMVVWKIQTDQELRDDES